MSNVARVRRLCRGLHPRHLRVLLVAGVVEIGLRTMSLPRLARLLGLRMGGDGPTAAEPVAQPDPAAVRRIRRSFRATDRVLRRWPFGNTCLRRALVLGHLISGLEPTLCIGVRRDETRALVAHAWLTVAGFPLDPTAAHYLSFDAAA